MRFASNLLNLHDKDIVLASSSPRRRELLEMIGLKFKVHKFHFKEKAPSKDTKAIDFVQKIVKNKMDIAKEAIDANLIITADTVVCVDSLILGKPKDEDQAKLFLQKLSNTTHQVISAFCLKTKDKEIATHEITNVSFSNLSADEIKQYIDTGEPFDKAGAYGIQGLASLFIEKIDGCYFNVMGLPIHRLYQEIKDLNLQ